MDIMRDLESESADNFQEHVNQMVFKNGKFERGFYSSFRSDPVYLPIPFPRFFTPKRLAEDGQLKFVPEK